MPNVSLRRKRAAGQALTEFALIFPIVVLVFFGVIVLGLYVFYTQEITNAAREAARYAVVHSSTAKCPTVSWTNPALPMNSYRRCDSPNDSTNTWPQMTSAARGKVFGIAPASVVINACWSGYVPPGSPAGTLADQPAVGPSPGNTANTYVQCEIGGVDPITNPGGLGCSTGLTTSVDDPASDLPNNRVTVYVCMVWRPPMAGFLLIPTQVTIRGIVTEVIQRQQ